MTSTAKRAFRTDRPIPAVKRTHTPTSPYAKREIGPEGGVIHLSNAGLRLTVPAGAVSARTLFEVSAHRSVLGFTVNQTPLTTLAKPVLVEQDVSHEAIAEAGDTGFVLGYTNMVDDEAACHEFYAMTRKGNTLHAEVPHFSGYMVSMGLTAVPCDPADGDPNCVWVEDPA